MFENMTFVKQQTFVHNVDFRTNQSYSFLMLNIEREFGALLRQRRGVAGYSQAELADEADVSRSSIISWEKGASTPSIVSLYKLAAALQVEPQDLLPKEESIMIDTSLESVNESVLASVLDDIRGK